jgi:hypothetical protein
MTNFFDDHSIDLDLHTCVEYYNDNRDSRELPAIELRGTQRLIIPSEQVKRFFRPCINSIVKVLSHYIERTKERAINSSDKQRVTIVLAGGFAMSPFLREELKVLRDCDFILLDNPDLAIVRGAARFGTLCASARTQRSPSDGLQLDGRGWASASDVFSRHREVKAAGFDEDDPASAAADQETLRHLLETRPTDERDPNMLTHIMASVAANTGRRVHLSTLTAQGQSASSISAFTSLLNNVADTRMTATLVLKKLPVGEFQDVPVQYIVGNRCVRRRFEVHMQREIAATLGVSPEDVTILDFAILDVRQGSISVDFTISAAMNALKTYELLKEKFAGTFEDMRLDPALAQLEFETWELDPRGDKNFSGRVSTFEIGPPGMTKTYTQPGGWTRYGLQVLERYGADQTWLHPFGHQGNWYRAYHGTGSRAGTSEATSKIAKSIYREGLRIGPRQARESEVGAKGVYCSPILRTAEEFTYSGFPVPLADGTTRRFLLVFQCAVKPGGVRICSDGNTWVVPDPAHIRPYGILLKMKSA